MEYVKRTFAIAFAFYVIGWLSIPIPHATVLSATAGGISILLFVGGAIAWIVIQVRARKKPSAINVIRASIWVVMSLIFPFSVVALASSGDTLSEAFRGNGYNW